MAIGAERNLPRLFRNLVFLIRDWNCTPSQPYGECSVTYLIPTNRGDCQTKLVQVTRRFENISGFRLPHPGNVTPSSVKRKYTSYYKRLVENHVAIKAEKRGFFLTYFMYSHAA